MADKEKPKGGVVVVLNQGQRPYQTSAGVLKVGESQELPEKEGTALLAYKGVVDASKVVAGAGKLLGRALRKENERLRKENEELKKGKSSKAYKKAEKEEEKKEKEEGGE